MSWEQALQGARQIAASNRNEHFDAGAGLRIVHETDGPEGRVRAVRGDQEVAELTYHHNQGYFDRPTLAVDDLHVASQHRGTGVATSLYAKALEAHPGADFTHNVEAMSDDALRLSHRLHASQPGRHRWWDGQRASTTPPPTRMTP